MKYVFAEPFLMYFAERAKLSVSKDWIGKSTASEKLTPIYMALRAIKLNFQLFFREKKIDWIIQASIGQGAATPDHYIAFLPPGQKVSNGIYYCFCFDRDGKGCVGGAMTSLLTTQRIDEQTIERAMQISPTAKNPSWELRKPNKINVWSRNNAFFNPVEFSRDDFEQVPAATEKMMEEHIVASRQLVLSLISRKKNLT